MRVQATRLAGMSHPGQRQFDPKTQWAAGENGFLLRPFDWRTLFQDVNGDVPVTAAGQPIALALDTRLGVPVRRNLFNTTDTARANATCTVDNNVRVSPYTGLMTGDYVRDSSATAPTGEHYSEIQYNVVAGRTYTYSLTAEGDGSGKKLYIRTALRGVAVATFNFSTGAIESATAGLTAASEPVPGFPGISRVWFTYVPTSSGLAVFRPQIMSASNQTVYTGNGTGFYLYGQMLEEGPISDYQYIGATWAATVPGNHAVQATATSRPVTALDANGVGRAVFDGVDDFWTVPSMNLTGGNKLSLFAAIRKTSTTAGSIIGQSNSISFPGFWELGARTYATHDLALTVAGAESNTVQNYLSYPPNTSSIIAAQINGAGATMSEYFKMRVNGLPASPGASTAGPYSVGGFKNEQITIGSRGSGSNRFGGAMYAVGLRSALTPDADVAKMEKWLNGQTRIY